MGRRSSAGGKVASRARPLTEALLRLIWTEQRISRADIARRAQLSRSTVSELVGALLETGLVRESGRAPSSGGRRAIMLEFQDDAYGILGVEVGASHVGVAATDLRGRVLSWVERPHPVRDDPDGTRALAIALGDQALAEAGIERRRLLGIGMALPAPVDPGHPDHVSPIVLPAWEGRGRMDVVASYFGVPLLVDNDANLGALAEHWWGAGRGIQDLAYIKVATGVGSGHLVDGRIYRGATGVAGEIGHIVIDASGPPCVCGLRGCLTTFVGRAALVARVRELAAEHPGSVLAAREPTVEALIEAARAGDRLALRVAYEAAERLGVAISGLLNLMNPARVVIGGALAQLGDLLLNPLRENVYRRTLVSSIAAAEVVTSDLGPRSVALGAATLILDAALEDSRVFHAAVS